MAKEELNEGGEGRKSWKNASVCLNGICLYKFSWCFCPNSGYLWSPSIVCFNRRRKDRWLTQFLGEQDTSFLTAHQKSDCKVEWVLSKREGPSAYAFTHGWVERTQDGRPPAQPAVADSSPQTAIRLLILSLGHTVNPWSVKIVGKRQGEGKKMSSDHWGQCAG